MHDELTKTLRFVLDLLKDYGLEDFYLELSTKDPEKSVGSDEIWDEATRTLEEVATASGLELVPDPGGAAFYGPKISVQARDAIGRTWQMSTISSTSTCPSGSSSSTPAPDGSRQRPVMIHRALFGSIERFVGVLVEHYAGAFRPGSRRCRSSRSRSRSGTTTTCRRWPRSSGSAASGSRSTSPTTGCRRRSAAQLQKVPFMVIAGDRDVEDGAVSFRYRNGEQDNGVSVDDAIARVVDAVERRIQV